MGNRSKGSKNFIIGIREMSLFEKVFLGLECMCYAAAASGIVLTGIKIAGGVDGGSTLTEVLATGCYVMNSQTFRLIRKRKTQNRKRNEKVESKILIK